MVHMGAAACAAVVCVLAWGGYSHAQSAQPINPAGPADPALQAPAFRYDSPYSTYQRFEEQKPASWRTLNDEVERLGGHMGHVKDAAMKEPPSAAPPQNAARPAQPTPSTTQAAPSTPQLPANAAPKPAQPATGGAHKHHH